MRAMALEADVRRLRPRPALVGARGEMHVLLAVPQRRIEPAVLQLDDVGLGIERNARRAQVISTSGSHVLQRSVERMLPPVL